MSEFITTKGIAYHIEELIKKADKEITFVTPYLKISPLLLERLVEHDQKGLFTTIIYGKEELRNDQKLAIGQLKNLNLYFSKNLHAKCYYNEKRLLITSMNLHEFSENNNREFGIAIDAQRERHLYQEVVKEVESIKVAAVLQQKTYKPKMEVCKQTAYQKYSYQDLMAELCKVLNLKYPYAHIKRENDMMTAKNFMGLNIDLTNKYGFATLGLHDDNPRRNHRHKDNHYEAIYHELKSYRVFWSSPFDQICLYHQSKLEFMDIQDDVRYCVYGLETLVNALRRLNIIKEL